MTSAIVLFLIIVFSLAVFFYKKYDVPLAFLVSLNGKQQVALGLVIGDAYQNIYGYKTVCRTENISLEKYPEKYKEFMKDELKWVNKILNKDDLTLESAIYLFLPQKEMEVINMALYREMRMIGDSNESGIRSSCLLFEEQAEEIALGMAKNSKQKYNEIFYSILR